MRAVPHARPHAMRRFRLGRQEDSHEFLRCLLDAMHEACLKPLVPKPPPELAATTLIYRIFAGKLRSQVREGGGGEWARGRGRGGLPGRGRGRADS